MTPKLAIVKCIFDSYRFDVMVKEYDFRFPHFQSFLVR